MAAIPPSISGGTIYVASSHRSRSRYCSRTRSLPSAMAAPPDQHRRGPEDAGAGRRRAGRCSQLRAREQQDAKQVANYQGGSTVVIGISGGALRDLSCSSSCCDPHMRTIAARGHRRARQRVHASRLYGRCARRSQPPRSIVTGSAPRRHRSCSKRRRPIAVSRHSRWSPARGADTGRSTISRMRCHPATRASSSARCATTRALTGSMPTRSRHAEGSRARARRQVAPCCSA